MRVHVTVPERVARDLDRRVGACQRSSFVARPVERGLEHWPASV